ncbi:alpha/beta fold hydrolase [Planctobacterium marinum]|uniref:3-oxoadipate enol-lactonase n=1 Tax=Planctobacterium marinum TaxID=1631968 RepID=A0AA48HN41_9ALTE|nr:3-oxoadipate enol-lactonase [Planctobacterium marinum]
MPQINVNGANLFYQETGAGKETIVFSHGYLMNHTMFAGQVERLQENYRCISFEHRGHGQSEVTTSGYELDNLVSDAIALIEQLDCGPVHFVGMSTGGFVGMRIALRRPDLLRSLVLMSTSAEDEPQAALQKNTLLLKTVKNLGWWPVIGKVLPMMFHSSFLKVSGNKKTVNYWKQTVTEQNKKAMVAFGESIFSRDNVLSQLQSVSMPVAVMVGEFDVLTPPECSQRMVDNIPGARLFTIADAGHSAAIEKATEVADAMEEFYAGIKS